YKREMGLLPSSTGAKTPEALPAQGESSANDATRAILEQYKSGGE
ncbi:MAG: hypothetical protein JO360_10485, partial [Acidobacteria bacterium]|nr:hypothetical protein [Acidobacteriota bacterium]